MLPTPPGAPPFVSGLTQGMGTPPGDLKPDEMLAMMMGQRPQRSGSPDKMAQVVQLLREITAGDPRLAPIAGEMMRVALEGPPKFSQQAQAGQPPIAGGGPPSAGPTLGPRGMA